MLRHLSLPAWAALEAARVEAGRRGEPRIAPEHLLLGLLHDRTNRASQAVARCGVVLDDVIEAARSACGPEIRNEFADRALYDDALQLVLERAASMGGAQLDTGRMLKALARDRTSRAAKILELSGADGVHVDRAVESVPAAEVEGPAIDESDPLFDAGDGGGFADSTVHVYDVQLDDVWPPKIEIRALTDADVGEPPPGRLFMVTGLTNLLASVFVALVVVEALSRGGQALDTGSMRGNAVVWLGLVSLAISSIAMLCSSAWRLLAAVSAVSTPRWLALNPRRAPSWMAIAIVGALLGGMPGWLIIVRTISRDGRSVIDYLAASATPEALYTIVVPVLPMVFVAINALCWIAYARQRQSVSTPTSV